MSEGGLNEYYTLLGICLLGRKNCDSNASLAKTWIDICGKDMDEFFYDVVMDEGDVKEKFDIIYEEMKKQWQTLRDLA